MADYLELVQRLRGVNWVCHTYGKDEIRHDTVCHEAADAIELLQRELKCSKEMWEQQQELALEYLADIEKANERIADLEAALKPFANVTPVLQEDDHGVIYEWALNCDDIRAARKVLGENK